MFGFLFLLEPMHIESTPPLLQPNQNEGPDKKRLTDFGCGPGLYANRMAEAGASVTGIDISPVSIAHAKGQAKLKGQDIEYIEANYLEHQASATGDSSTCSNTTTSRWCWTSTLSSS